MATVSSPQESLAGRAPWPTRLVMGTGLAGNADLAPQNHEMDAVTSGCEIQHGSSSSTCPSIQVQRREFQALLDVLRGHCTSTGCVLDRPNTRSTAMKLSTGTRPEIAGWGRWMQVLVSAPPRRCIKPISTSLTVRSFHLPFSDTFDFQTRRGHRLDCLLTFFTGSLHYLTFSSTG